MELNLTKAEAIEMAKEFILTKTMTLCQIHFDATISRTDKNLAFIPYNTEHSQLPSGVQKYVKEAIMFPGNELIQKMRAGKLTHEDLAFIDNLEPNSYRKETT